MRNRWCRNQTRGIFGIPSIMPSFECCWATHSTGSWESHAANYILFLSVLSGNTKYRNNLCFQKLSPPGKLLNIQLKLTVLNATFVILFKQSRDSKNSVWHHIQVRDPFFSSVHYSTRAWSQTRPQAADWWRHCYTCVLDRWVFAYVTSTHAN